MKWSEERYDGKSRKDDIKKWMGIVAAALIVIVACAVGMHQLKKSAAADYTIVDMCDGNLSDEAKAYVQQVAAEVIGDKNGNGNVKISFKEVLPAAFGGYGESAGALFTGDYVLFLMLDPDSWNEDILAEKIDLSGTEMWELMKIEMPVYACILNTDEEEIAEAEQIVSSMLGGQIPTDSDEDISVPDDIPGLYAASGNQKIEAVLTDCSWAAETSESDGYILGTTTGVTDDEIQVIRCTGQNEIILSFDIESASMSVTRWPRESYRLGEAPTARGTAIELNDNKFYADAAHDYIYEISVSWIQDDSNCAGTFVFSTQAE